MWQESLTSWINRKTLYMGLWKSEASQVAFYIYFKLLVTKHFCTIMKNLSSRFFVYFYNLALNYLFDYLLITLYFNMLWNLILFQLWHKSWYDSRKHTYWVSMVDSRWIICTKSQYSVSIQELYRWKSNTKTEAKA